MNSFNLYHNPAKLNIIIPPLFFIIWQNGGSERLEYMYPEGMEPWFTKNSDAGETEEPGRLQSMGLQRVRQDLATKQQLPDCGTWFFPKVGEGKTSGFHTQKQVAILGIKGGV